MIIRVFPRETSLTPRDDLSFVGWPQLMRPEADEVHVSVTFTWDIPLALVLRDAWAQYYPVVKIGGPAISGETGEFVPGRYLREGVTFTSKGCVRRCGFCLVPKREGHLKLLDPIPAGYIIQDNNFAACPADHRRKAYVMLAKQSKAAVFSGGIDARLVDDELAAEFRDIRIAEIFLAADSEASLRPLEHAVKRLQFLRRPYEVRRELQASEALRCYVLIGFGGETIEQAEKRLETVYQIDAMPFAMLYQSPDRWIEYSDEWRALRRQWIRPAAIRASHQEAEC